MGGELVTLKKTVAGCLSDGKMFRQFLGIGLKSEINRIGNPDSPDYDSQLGVGRELENLRQNAAADGVTLPVNESYDTHLKKLVREHLTRLSNSKKKSTITNKFSFNVNKIKNMVAFNACRIILIMLKVILI